MSAYEEEEKAVKGFPAFPPRKGGRSRGQSWWGRAWTKAMENTSLDPQPLQKGRAFARGGHLGPIIVSPGRIAGQVHDGIEETPFTTVVHIERLDDNEWERFLGTWPRRPGIWRRWATVRCRTL